MTDKQLGGLFSSATDEWATPQEFFDELNGEFHFALDPAANEDTVVMLLPARTDTRWFHKYIYGKAEVRFVRGRLKFGGAAWNAPFPSMIVIYRKK